MGFNLYNRDNHSVLLELLGECMQKGQTLLKHSWHSINCSFYYYYYPIRAHAYKPGPTNQLDLSASGYMTHVTPTHLPEMFLSEQPQSPWPNNQANKWVKENHIQQTSAWPIVKVHVPWSLHVSGEQWPLHLCMAHTCYSYLGWHIDSTAGGMNDCSISSARFMICFNIPELHLSRPTGSLLLI